MYCMSYHECNMFLQRVRSRNAVRPLSLRKRTCATLIGNTSDQPLPVHGKMPKAQIGSGLRTDPRAGLTGHMQDRVRRFRVFLKVLDGLRRGANDDLHATSLGLGQDLVHDRQPTVHAGADQQALASPGDRFFQRDGSVTELVPVFARGLLLPLSQAPLVQDHVLLISLAIDLDRTEAILAPLHGIDPPIEPRMLGISSM